MLELDLRHVEGIVGIYNGTLPDRMTWLAPDALRAFDEIRGLVVLSDCWRSPEASLYAMQKKRGVQPPGYSRHGFGRAIDLDTKKSKLRAKAKNKRELDEQLAAHGWYCHRLDHKEDFEGWHYNYVPQLQRYQRPADKSTAAAGERELQALFGAGFALTAEQLQQCLLELGIAIGGVDGRVGPVTRHGVALFCRTWLLPESTPWTSARLQRTLAFVAAAKRFRVRVGLR